MTCVCIKTTPLFSYHFTAAVEQTSIVSSDESKSLYDTVYEHNFMRLVFHTVTRNEQDWFYYTVGTSRRMPQQGFPSVHWPTIMSVLLLHIKFLFLAHPPPFNKLQRLQLVFHIVYLLVWKCNHGLWFLAKLQSRYWERETEREGLGQVAMCSKRPGTYVCVCMRKVELKHWNKKIT